MLDTRGVVHAAVCDGWLIHRHRRCAIPRFASNVRHLSVADVLSHVLI